MDWMFEYGYDSSLVQHRNMCLNPRSISWYRLVLFDETRASLALSLIGHICKSAPQNMHTSHLPHSSSATKSALKWSGLPIVAIQNYN